ncbi:MAG: hypothetical protein AAGN66_27930 [Acidobacteriota bacterium]
MHVNPNSAHSAQDLSGDQIKVVQYCIISVVSGIADNARVLVGPKVVAFGDSMTPEGFTAWIIAENCLPEVKPMDPCYPPGNIAKCWDRKYLRVAFFVMGRFDRAEIRWEELQALSVARIAEKMPPCPCPPPNEHAGHAEQAAAAAAATVASGESSDP